MTMRVKVRRKKKEVGEPVLDKLEKLDVSGDAWDDADIVAVVDDDGEEVDCVKFDEE